MILVGAFMPPPGSAEWRASSSRSPLLDPSADRRLQRFGDRRVADRVDGIGKEGLDEQALGFRARYAAREKVEEHCRVDLAGGGAVAALDVIGKDLELGLGSELGGVGEQERPR